MFSTPPSTTPLPRKNSAPRVTAIIPAYNEASRIGRVLDVITTYPAFTEIIVIDDSSEDDTAAVTQRYPVMYLRGQGRQGKGKAMDTAFQQAHGDIIFFCDADITGLTHDIIKNIIQPVLNRQATMSVAVRGRGVPWFTTFLARLFPRATLIAGERALTRQLWEQLPAQYKQGYKIEIALNHLAHQTGGLTWRTFPSLEHVPKELKLGFIEGMTHRLKEIVEVVGINLYLHFAPIEPLQKKDRATSQ